MLAHFTINNSIGIADNGDDSYRIDLIDGTSRLATADEILQARRAMAVASIKSERDRREQSGFLYLGKLIDSDPVACQRIQVAATTAQLALANGITDFSLDWTCADNSILTLDAIGVLGMIQTLGLHGVHTHYFAKALKAQVAVSDDPESIDILSGWPE